MYTYILYNTVLKDSLQPPLYNCLEKYKIKKLSPGILVDAKRVKLNQLGHTHVWCRANSPTAKFAKRQICRSEFWSLCLVMILERKHAAIIWISLRWCTVLYSLSSRFNHFSSRINSLFLAVSSHLLYTNVGRLAAINALKIPFL